MRSEDDRDHQIRQFWRFVVKLLVTVAVAWYLLRKVPLANVRNALGGASPIWIALGFTVQIVIRLVNAWRIRLIAGAQGAPLSFVAILSVLFTSALYGLLLPGSIGGGAATLVKYVGRGATAAAALASMVVNRLLETLTVMSFAAFFWGLAQLQAGAARSAHLATILVIAAPLLLMGAYALLFGRIRLLARVEQWPVFGERRRLTRGLGALLQQCARAGTLRATAAVGVCSLSMLKELLATLAAYCFARSLGIDLPFVAVAWMQSAVGLLVLLPITISGLGVREGTLVLATRTYGVEPATALSWGLVQFASLLGIVLIGGLIEARAWWLAPARST
jgi:uncharacterized protein (TIRG00374 family)